MMGLSGGEDLVTLAWFI